MNCPNCQTVNPEAAKFCMNCGMSLTAAAPVKESSQLAVGNGNVGGSSKFNLDRYLPNELITKLESARSRNAMMGERHPVGCRK